MRITSTQWINGITVASLGSMLISDITELPPPEHIEQPVYDASCSQQPLVSVISGANVLVRFYQHTGDFDG
jgi:hypothetical protein